MTNIKRRVYSKPTAKCKKCGTYHQTGGDLCGLCITKALHGKDLATRSGITNGK